MSLQIVYLAYRDPAVLAQTVLSILSLRKHCSQDFWNQAKVVIYTDHATYFIPYLIDIPHVIETIDYTQIDKWKGVSGFFFRVKIQMIAHAFAQRPEDKILYLDGDTFFTQGISYLLEKESSEKVWMHEYEGVFDQSQPDKRKGSTAKQIAQILKKESFTLKNGTTYQIDVKTPLWNAGAMCIPTSFAQKLPDVLALTDQLYQLKDAHTMEQFAFSYFLGQHVEKIENEKLENKIQALDSSIFHYWYFKEYGSIAEAFLHFYHGQSMAKMIENIAYIDPQVLSKPKWNYLHLPFWTKNYHKYFKGKWALPSYTFGT